MENKKQKIHFIGIGGIGVSALARYFLAQGNEVSGSDAVESGIIGDLRKMDVKINIADPSTSSGNINFNDIDKVIYSAAVREDDPELLEARRLNVRAQKYAEALGELTKEKFTIAVSGMHGKSTTTAMIGLMMEKAGLDPTVIVGTKLKEWGNSNCRVGKSKYLLIEADEYDKSILNYWPKILVLLNIEEEHLDTYRGGLPEIMETFGEYISHLPEDGVLVANDEDENVKKISKTAKSEIIYYSSSKAAGRVEKSLKEKVLDSAPVALRSNNNIPLNLKIPGKHNLSNANAALAVAKVLGIDEKIAVEALNDFSGAWRRMECKGELNGAKIYDDYGHHPTEIKTTLEGARSLLPERSAVDAESKADPSTRFARSGNNSGRLWCVFQPHQYHRTYDLFDQFIGAFGSADKTIILPIYSVAGREDEEIKQKVSSEKLVQAINNGKEVLYMSDFDKVAEYLRKNLQSGDVCVIMGAGDIYKLTELVVLKQKARD